MERDVHLLVLYLRYATAAPALVGHVRTAIGIDMTRTLSCFLGESRFNLSHVDSRVRVYRRKGERFALVCVRQHDRFSSGVLWFGAG